MVKLLLVLSASRHWTLADGTAYRTGYWAEEFAVAHRTFREAGITVVVATPAGIPPVVDQASLSAENDGGGEKAAAVRRYIESVGDELAAPASLDQMEPQAGSFAAVFIPGGHGPMEDLAENSALGLVVTQLHWAGRIVAALCHGPAGLLPARHADGRWLFEGLRMTGFTDEEERGVGLAARAPWLLEDRLRAEGGIVETGPAWQPHVVVDGNLITGQNPASSRAAADQTIAALAAAATR